MLKRGQVTKSQLLLLIKLTKIRSPELINALELYLVGGLTQRQAAEEAGITQGLLSIRLRTLREIEEIVCELQPYYLQAHCSYIEHTKSSPPA